MKTKETFEALQKLMPTAKHTAIIADKIIENEEEFFNSKELAHEWDGFQGLDTYIAVCKKSSFIKAFVINTDPKENYGKLTKVYKVYEAEGITHVKEVSKISSLTSGPMRGVILNDDGFIITDSYYNKDEQTRKFLRQSKIPVI